MVGAKTLFYCFDATRVSQQQGNNLQVFYQLVAGVDAQERQLLQLSSDVSSYRYLGAFQQLKSSLKASGFRKDHISRILQLLAAILHIGNFVFMDPSAANGGGGHQEAAYVKNAELLDSVADMLGLDPHALENVLTFKTKMIRKDMTTLILNAEQAQVQCDELVQVLYSLLFSWLVNRMNKKQQNQKSFSNFIGILDFPGAPSPSTTTTSGFNTFCLNLANERIQHFFLSRVFTSTKEIMVMKDDKISACLELLLRPSKSISTLVNTMTESTMTGKRSFTDNNLMDSITKYNGQHRAFALIKSSTGARQFAVEHYTGSVTYHPDGFIQGNSNSQLSMDFITLFRGNTNTPASWNGFLVELFSDDNLATWDPSLHQKKDTSPTVLGQTISALDDLFHSIQDTTVWSVQCIQPNDQRNPTQFDSRRVQQQMDTLYLPQMIQQLKSVWPHSWTHQAFIDRYSAVLQSQDIDTSRLPRSCCDLVLDSFGWTDRHACVDSNNIFLAEESWIILENKLRQTEKDQQRQTREAEDNTTTSLQLNPISSTASDDHQFYYSEEDDDTTNGSGGGGQYQDGSYYGTGSISYPIRSDTKEMEAHDLQITNGNNNIATNETTAKEDKESTKRKVSAQRKQWLFFVWMVTWWIPSPCLTWCGHMKRKDIQIAWREKVTLCFMIFLLCGFVMWFLVFFGEWVCPHQDVFSISELQDRSDKDNAYVAIRGEVFDLTSFAPRHYPPNIVPTQSLLDYAGKDITALFPVQVSSLCDGTTSTPVSPFVSLDYQVNLTDKNAQYHDFRYSTDNYRPNWYYDQMTMLRQQYKKGNMGFEYKTIYDQANTATLVNGIKMTRNWAVLDKRVYDLSSYLLGGRYAKAPSGQQPPGDVNFNFMDDTIVNLFRTLSGTDITKAFNQLPLDAGVRKRQLVCLRNLFYVGMLDSRNSPQCLFSTYLLLIVTCLLASVILFKFLAALRIGGPRAPEEHDKFVICQITCYTEDEESLRKTIDSIAKLTYDDKRKLMFIICDGMIVGSGNDRPTPRIVLDILKVDDSQVVDPEPLSFVSVGEGLKQHNMGKVYSGLYEVGGHVVPYLVVVKCGTATERQKPGNRGKRDSQLVLMQFLNRVHFDAPMNPLQLEIYHQMKNVIGVNPGFYEFVLMVDADTEVLPDGLNNLVSAAVHDSKIIGICGETTLSNEKDTWVTMIQVYEYFISHHMIKAFESLFSTVSCLPGCFTMYRVRTVDGKRALFISNEVINDYSVNIVDTLHKKNLLHLGEDRYLTTLLLKHFANFKTKFTSDAQCRTNAPDQWSVLVSQRRRWINSTIHNLGELMFLPRLCGFCCFSMRFVVILDLISTLVMPALVGYLIYLIYTIATASGDTVPYISIGTIAGVYGLQALLFIIKRKWEYIIWMLVSVLAIPVFSFYIPIYSYWHFDDFSWGNTRVVMGDTGKKFKVADEGKFDPKTIPTMTWTEYEKMILVDNNNNNNDGMSQLSGSVYTTNQSGYNVLPVSEYGYDTSDTISMHPSANNMRTASGLYTMDGSMMLPSSGSIMMMPSPGPIQRYSLASINHPSNEEILQQVQHILSSADLTQITKKQVREQLQLIFGISMVYKKDYINACIENILQDRIKSY
ncbi:chitin synthase-domain-containing protein [Chlamydoabsidia padenii]|nr:chitin synthase-domain-containing protein [Chlamydoabsidia padenii]